jgi:hypothetical protein
VTVTVTAAIALVVVAAGVFQVYENLFAAVGWNQYLTVFKLENPAASAFGGLHYSTALANVVLIALLAWGAIAALRGVTARILMTAMSAVVAIAEFVDFSHRAYGTAVVDLILPTLIVTLLVAQSSRDFFRARLVGLSSS